MSNFPNPKNIRFEPKVPIEYVAGEPVQAEFSWANIPRIQLGTDPDWWGNAITDNQVGSKYYEYSDEPILADGKFLARKSALAVEAVRYLKESGIASKVTAESFNPEADNVDVELTIIERLNPDGEIIMVVADYRKEPYDPGSTEPVVIKSLYGSLDVLKDTYGNEDVIKDTVS